MSEEWRPIPSCPGYQASSQGRIMSPRGRVLRQHKHKGYRRITIGTHAKGDKRNVSVHRLVCEAFHGPAPSSRHQAAHENHDKADNRPHNLRWATPRANTLDSIAAGTWRLAEFNARARARMKRRRIKPVQLDLLAA